MAKRNWNSLPAWGMFTVAMFTTLISCGYTYANLESKIDRNREEIARNEREDRERNSRVENSLRDINTTIANFGQLRTDVEVMKNQLTAINETLRRLERKFEPPVVSPKMSIQP